MPTRTAPSRRESEADFQLAVIQIATYNGWRHYHTHDSRHSVAGFPDLVLVRPPRLLVVELKAEGGRVSVEQAAWIGAFTAVGGSIRFVVEAARDAGLVDGLQEPSVEAYVWKPPDWPEIERVLARTPVPTRPRI